MGVIAKYKFDQNIYENFIPEFDSTFTNYTITDEIDTDGFTVRTIESDSLPTLMRFGSNGTSGNSDYYIKQYSLLEVNELNTNNVNTMSSMFYQCKNLTYINTNFNTSKVTNMLTMFYNCSSLTSLDLSSFNTSQVDRMDGMFYNCSSLTSLDLSSFNTSQVDRMDGIFYNCSSLTSLDVSNFDTNIATNMSGMFQNCSSLTSLDVSNFNTSQVTNMGNMFRNCFSLTSLDLSNFNTSQVTNMSYMFYLSSKLTSLDVSNFDTSNVTNMDYMFHSCYSLTSLDLSNFNTSNVTNMDSMFTSCSSLTSLDVSSFNTENVVNMSAMFYDCSSLTSLDVSNFDTSQVTVMSYMFYNCTSLTSLDLSNFNTEKVTNMQGMFQKCSSLTSLDVSNFDTENVTTMQNTFSDCSSLTSLNVSNFNTKNVTIMSWMFNNCSSLISLDVSNFNTSQATFIDAMFANCLKLASINVLNFDTGKATNISYIFQNCSSLISIDVSNWSTNEATNMRNMFFGCTSLTSLDISNFNTNKVTDMTAMFNNCSSLSSMGMVYCNVDTINKISSSLLNIPNTKIYYSLPDISELEPHDNVEYIKYIFPTKIQLPPHIQLHSLPDGTRDEVDIKTGILTRNVGYKVYDENMAWGSYDVDFYYTSENIGSNTFVFYSNDLKQKTSTQLWNGEEGYMVGAVIGIRKHGIKTKEEFLEYIAKNPIPVVYGLSEPTTEQLILNYNNSCDYGRILPTGTSDNYNVITNEYKQNLDSISIDGSITFDTATIKDTTVKYSVSLSKFDVDITNTRGDDGIYCSNDLFKYEVSDNDYEHAYIENDTTLHIYVNKSRLSSYDQIGLQLYLIDNPFDLYYAMRNPIISYVNYEDLDPEKASWEMLDCTEGGSITIESGNMDKTLLLDCVDYIAPTKNRFEIDLLKPNTQYTVYAEGVSGRVQLNFGGNIVNFTSGNIYTSGETQLVEFYTDNEIKNLIIIEGDTRNETINFFEGLKSSENVTVISSNAPFVFGKGGKIQ